MYDCVDVGVRLHIGSAAWSCYFDVGKRGCMEYMTFCDISSSLSTFDKTELQFFGLKLRHGLFISIVIYVNNVALSFQVIK